MNARVPPIALEPALALDRVSQAWDSDIVRQLTDYIAIPAKSPMFAADWAEQGLLDTVVRNAAAWVESQKVAGLTLEVVRLPDRTPVLFFEIEATQAHAPQTVLMYGHLDKQPEFSGWRSDLVDQRRRLRAPLAALSAQAMQAMQQVAGATEMTVTVERQGQLYDVYVGLSE